MSAGYSGYARDGLPIAVLALSLVITPASSQKVGKIPVDLSTLASEFAQLSRLRITHGVSRGLKGGHEFTMRGDGMVTLRIWPPNSNRKLLPVCSGSVGQDVVDEALGAFAGVDFEGLNDHSGVVYVNAFDVTHHHIVVQLGDERVSKVFDTGPDASKRSVSPELLKIEKKLQELKDRVTSEKKLKCAPTGS